MPLRIGLSLADQKMCGVKLREYLKGVVAMITQRVSFQEDIALTKDILSSISLFGALNPQQLQSLLQVMHIRHYQSGDQIFTAGDLPSDIYVLLKGRVDFLVEKDSIHRIQHTFRLGQMIGETAVIGIQKQIGTAVVTAGDAELLVLSREALIDIQRQDAELFGILMMNIARDVSRKLHEV